MTSSTEHRPAATVAMPRYLTLYEVRDILGCSERWLYDQVRTGRLSARKIAGSYRFTIAEVERFADSFLVQPGPL